MINSLLSLCAFATGPVDNGAGRNLMLGIGVMKILVAAIAISPRLFTAIICCGTLWFISSPDHVVVILFPWDFHLAITGIPIAARENRRASWVIHVCNDSYWQTVCKQ